ncbi:hypothetical protein CISG_00994 [Coccidioides immitis RMSCC 3703]|uniref:Uncharacterized protein n=1 Tax=Coccidioides immitis RMSCC 3703 TaxID=454286 RepID=A0A0J8QTP8_COCIT|nr:hypothetical protein CISG_00994 [Coccidioides immitis RMSCC 3703]
MQELAGFLAHLAFFLSIVLSGYGWYLISLLALQKANIGKQVVSGVPILEERAAAAGYFSGLGICYAPYTDGGQCKPQQEIDADFAKLKKYQTIRIYGVDCNQVRMVLNTAKKNNSKVFAGIFNLKNFDGDLESLISQAKDSWSNVAAINIGNELVNRGLNSPDQVADAVKKARDILRGAGYQGPVVTVDTSGMLIKHPKLCHASDFCAANAHAFFSSQTKAQDAGKFARNEADAVSKAAGGKFTVITESGWPSSGQPNGVAVPSPQNQNAAVESLKNSFKDRDGQLFLFSAFDDKWKQDFDGSFGRREVLGH